MVSAESKWNSDGRLVQFDTRFGRISIRKHNSVHCRSWMDLLVRYDKNRLRLWYITVTKYFLARYPYRRIHKHGSLTRYVKLRVAHAPGTFSPPRVSDPDMHHGTCVTHVPWCMPGSLTRGFLWSRWRGKRSRHYRRMRNPQFYASGKRPISIHG